MERITRTLLWMIIITYAGLLTCMGVDIHQMIA